MDSTEGSSMRIATLLMLVALTMAAALLPGCSSKSGDAASGTAGQGAAATAGKTADAEWTVTLLDGYPEDEVPLYKSNLLDTAYYSVRNDPQWAAVDGGLRNIHHIVYQTDVDIAEVRDYYRDLMDTVDEERTMGDQVEGTIGKYTVFVNTSEQGSYNAVYVTVDLPKTEVTETNPFYADYPEGLVETPESFVFFEEMFYRTIYRKTDMSYTRHFDIADLDGDTRPDLEGDARYAYFEERYGTKDEFVANRDSGTITWRDGEYVVTVAYMSGYARGVLSVGMDYKP
jgi:hypothetical protein